MAGDNRIDALVRELQRRCPTYASLVRGAAYIDMNDLATHERFLATAAADEIAQGRGTGLRAVFDAVDELYPPTTSHDGRHHGPWVLMGSLLDALISRGLDHLQVEALLPPGLRPVWELAVEDRFCPPHDGFW